MTDRTLELPGHFEKVATDAGWHVRITGANGEPVFSSEVYTEEKTADEAIRFVARSCHVPVGVLRITLSDERTVTT